MIKTFPLLPDKMMLIPNMCYEMKSSPQLNIATLSLSLSLAPSLTPPARYGGLQLQLIVQLDTYLA
jgi:hypothetical protein